LEKTQTTLVNVLGAGGSGTTLLGLMLGNGETGFACGELRVWYRPYSPAHFSLSCWCQQNPCPVWSRVGGFPEREVYTRIVETTGAGVITDSSKWLDWRRDTSRWARAQGMAVSEAVVWRRPLDMLHTWWRRGRLGKKDGRPPEGEELAQAARLALTRRFCSYYGAILDDTRGGAAVISYEELVERPGELLAALCGRIGIPYEEGQERFWEGGHHTLFGNDTVARTLRSDEPRLELPSRSPEFERVAEVLKPELDRPEVRRTLERLRASSLSVT
jgi:hypothetical protein